MGTPVLMLVDEDLAVLEALAGDLGRRFTADYQILAEGSPGAAMSTSSSWRRGHSRSPWYSPASG